MTRGSSKEALDRFIALSEQLGGKENTDEDFGDLANQFNSILADLLVNLDLFSPEQRLFIEEPVAQGQYVVSDTRCPALYDCEFE